MLYEGLDQEESCLTCYRRWVMLGGEKEPIIDLQDPRASDLPGEHACEECGGGW